MKKRNKKSAPEKKITVNSKAYGSHERAARGTYKPAPLNSVMKKSSGETTIISRISKNIKDSFDPFREGVIEGSMWQRLLAIVRTAWNKYGDFDYSALRAFELNSKSTLQSLPIDGTLRFRKGTPKELDVIISVTCKPGRKRDHKNTYRFTALVLFYALDKTHVGSETFVAALNSGVLCDHEMKCPIPKHADIAVTVIKCEQKYYANHASPENRAGMQIIDICNVKDNVGHLTSIPAHPLG